AELVRVALHIIGRQPHLLKKIGHPGLLLGMAPVPEMNLQGLRDNAENRHTRIQRTERILKDDLKQIACLAMSKRGEYGSITLASND
ncbi:MAG: hypothetical protein ABR533_02510, partial [Desulfonatronovibrio sp.]